MTNIRQFLVLTLVWIISLSTEATTSLTLKYISDVPKPVAGYKIFMSQNEVSIVGEAEHDFFNIFFSDLDGNIVIPDTSQDYHFISSNIAAKDSDPITVKDALYVLQHIVELRTLSSAQIRAADINADDQVTISDALMILQHIVGLRYIDFVDQETGRELNEIDWSDQGNKSLNFIRRGDVDQSYEPVVSLSGLIEGETTITMEENFCMLNGCSFLFAYGPIGFKEDGCTHTFHCTTYKNSSSITRFRLGFRLGYPDYDVWVPWYCPLKDNLGNCMRPFTSYSIEGRTGSTGDIDGGTHVVNINITNLDDSWAERGRGIEGTALGDRNGRSVAISGDGKTVAIGADGYSHDHNDNGNVRVFDWIENEWVQRGTGIDMKGKGNNSRAGYHVSMDSDGNTIAMGALNNPAGVRVFDWDGSAWLQRGNDITISEDEELGCYAVYSDLVDSGFCGTGSISMSDDGLTIAIGITWDYHQIGPIAGRVMVFNWDGSDWIQRGNTFEAEAHDNIGSSVSLSSNGNTIAVGAKGGNFVSIFDWDGGTWVIRGASIYGEADGDLSGYAVSMNSDGNTVAIGAPRNEGLWSQNASGHVRVFDWKDAAWVQRGTDIDGSSASESGYSVSISSDGNAIAIVAFNGFSRVYYWRGNAWEQQDVYDAHWHTDPALLNDFPAGQSISISADGNTFVKGQPGVSGPRKGIVNVYDWGHIRTYD